MQRRAGEREQRAERTRAVRRLELQLKTQPDELARLVPEDHDTRVSNKLPYIADGFVRVHARLAELYDDAGRVDEAAFQRRRAATLTAIARKPPVESVD